VTHNYLVTNATGTTVRISAAEYEAGLFAVVDVVTDVSGYSRVNRLDIIVHNPYLDVTDSWTFGRVLATTFADANSGNECNVDSDAIWELHRLWPFLETRNCIIWGKLALWRCEANL